MGIFGGEGQLVGGRYRLDIRLGRGGMGTVWRATDELLGRQVAVKELHLDEATAEPEARVQRERAMREARTVAQVKHPNVIVVHDVVEQDGRPWIVMELVDGPSLADRLYSGGPLAPREAARIAVALLGALRAAHARGVLHRDIKPANVLIESATNRVVLTDFGIAQVPGVTTLTEAGGFVGSPEYTAPERMAGRGTGPEADLWSLGVLMCAALSGESPFRRDSIGGILHAVVYDEIEIPEAARPLLAVIDGLLERDPEQRLAAEETERLLRGYLRTGRAPERSADRGPGGPGGRGRSPGPGEAAAASAPADPRRPGPDAHDPFYGNPSGDLPSEHPSNEDLLDDDGRSFPGSTPVAPTGYSGPRTPPGPGRARTGGRTPGVPIPDALDDRALAAAARPHTGRTRTALLVALAVAALGGAGAGIAALAVNQNDDGGNQGKGGASQQASPHTSRPGQTGQGTPEPSGPTGTVTSRPTGGNDPRIPAGYRFVRDPAGFALAVPDGFTRSYKKDRIYYSSQGRRFRIGVQLQKPVPQGPIGAMRTADAEGPRNYPGYSEGQVTETTHKGLQAGLWEFAWNGSAEDGGPRYTYDLSWEESGKMIDVWISSPVGSSTEAKRHFDTALDAFRLTG
ncbi:serine/threonine-protein kinase [Streptomyces sp. NPDC053427]|uniref:serine/threonine-protein kinase n=1 Tax=Streptomyces sp. NPDC053427 TaxID=3365701 RepID=UPI0037CD99A3